MSTDQPSQRALAVMRPLLRTLSSARQVYALYPAGHPNRLEVIRNLLALVRDLQDASDEPPVIFATRHSFYLGASLLARESLSLFRLVESFERSGIEAVELLPGVAEDDIDALILMILGEAPLRELVGGVAINRLSPVAAQPIQMDLTELRRAYASGLEVLRETAMRVAAGEAVDLDGATSAVEQLADEVMHDPAHALLLTTIKSYDEYTYYHMVNVALLSIAMGQAIGLRRDQIISLGLGGLLHDVGKIELPEDVLLHVGKLSEEQWRLIQQHPVNGAGMIFGTANGLYHPAATIVLEHHAAYDLSGYPPLSHRPLPSLPARLVSVADCFDAVTSKRAYRAAAERRQALQILESGSGKGFDPKLVRLFVAMLGLFPVGSLVQLDTGEIGLVVRNHDSLLARPVVLVVLDAAGNPTDGEERDLSLRTADDEFRWTVERSLDPDEVGIDVMAYLTTGELEASGTGGGAGLVHEPSYGEHLPPGYVDTHNDPATGHSHGHGHDHGRIDPDVHPPIEDPDGPR